ncbi:MAG: hypothetical protein GY787_16670 [Alteromonadales bacterium]|jgi:hypothetical protein|nr:hypothetical protein [Alteromonadales bacterium]
MALDPLFGSIVPSQQQQLLDTNYLSFNGGTGTGDSDTFAQQYLPEIYEQEVERYGNRTLSGFLRMVGAEMPMTSDQVIWSEQNRLHIAYEDCTNDQVNTISIPIAGDVKNVVSPQSTIVMLDQAGNELKGVVTASNLTSGDLTVAPFDATTTASLATTGIKIFVYGSEYAKGSTTPNNTVTAGAADGYISVDPAFTQFSNSPIIIRSKYVVSGSDTAQIGWVEVATEDGTSGYLWYLKAESETRLRFEDYLEMSVVEGEKADTTLGAGSAAAAGYKGTEGLFAAIQSRGNVEAGFNAANTISEFDAILRNLDTQGAIEENMLFLNRETSLSFDDMLAGVGAPQGTGTNYGGGSSYGIFENSEDMALNLGFSGFRRGSYDFYKTDWKYLNDASTRGAIENGLVPPGFGVSAIDGVLIPAGTSTVYDQILGTNIRRPFLHVRYRASQTDDRRMKSWLTGSVGGAFTSDLDAMEVNFLSERCLCVQGANNFVLFTK